ncbi:MAG: GNAT family N-acetyltransferase [Thermoplasmata archaeon]|nr:GNAT family N-acetyltransferase [Thermoplasmata archaeon]NIS13886.1 GNAT family N-acetyltransferase [Thermoplasmata archaeon]NIS21727.1 GNAT family N-acetyltransferase [Thermoplasmata archaeon]NIT79321.1 GNAT family N-acetyltransferase [Thermoplasmata archaeon]NIU50760.1 GNAT family N-acetyltransferase [Thermoplasmata archaeon]
MSRRQVDQGRASKSTDLERRLPELRGARFTDVPEMARLDRICFEEHAYSADLILRFLELDLPCVVAKREGGPMMGFAMVMPEPDERTCVLVTLDVLPEHRRRGLGTRMISWCARSMLDSYPQTELMWLTVASRNEGARAFYGRLGFREADVIEGYYGDDDAVVMVHLGMKVLADGRGP